MECWEGQKRRRSGPDIDNRADDILVAAAAAQGTSPEDTVGGDNIHRRRVAEDVRNRTSLGAAVAAPVEDTFGVRILVEEEAVDTSRNCTATVAADNLPCRRDRAAGAADTVAADTLEEEAAGDTDCSCNNCCSHRNRPSECLFSRTDLIRDNAIYQMRRRPHADALQHDDLAFPHPDTN